jgi:tellurite resistance protein
MLEGSTMSDNPAQDTSAQDALVMLMVMVSASDRAMKDEELAKIGEIVSSFPVFNGYSHDRLVATAETASLALSEEGGLESVVEAIAKAIPERLRDTAYACGVEVAAADLLPCARKSFACCKCCAMRWSSTSSPSLRWSARPWRGIGVI